MWSSATTRTGKIASLAVLLFGLLMFASMILPNQHLADDLYRISLAGVIVGCTVWVLSHVKSNAMLIEMVRQHAYDTGYADGCSANRSLRLVCDSDGPTLAASGPAQQLAEEFDVTG